MNQELATQKVDLALLPDVMQSNQLLAEKALLAINPVIEEISNLDMKTLDVLKGDEIESRVNDLRARGSKAEAMNKERRMVFTKKFDEIRAAFTTEEKKILDAVNQIAAWSNNWNLEKNRRALEIKKQQEAKIAHDNALIDYRNSALDKLEIVYTEEYQNVSSRMIKKFYAQDISTIEKYVSELQEWEPIFKMFDVVVPGNPLLELPEMKNILQECAELTFNEFSQKWVQDMKEEVQNIVEMMPSRIAELKRIANDATAKAESDARIAKEAKEKAEQLRKEQEEKAEENKNEAETSKLNAMFEAAAIAPAVQLSKGANIKQKYQPSTHKEIIQIIQWWVANDMGLMTIEELTKKFSFMLTSANKALNKGTVIEGIATIEDISTRVTKSK